MLRTLQIKAGFVPRPVGAFVLNINLEIRRQHGPNFQKAHTGTHAPPTTPAQPQLHKV
jgi:hypothetical protein